MYVLGIDIGTSSMEGMLSDKTGSIISTKQAFYDLNIMDRGFVEQKPQDWITAFQEIIEKLTQTVNNFIEQLASIVVSGQMHSLVMLDDDGKVIRDAILWNDTRTTKQCNLIKETLKEKLFEVTGNQALEGFTLPKILWVKENEAESFVRFSKFMMPKDYLNYYLTSVIATDSTDASGTLLLNLKNNVWDIGVLDAFDLDISICPKLISSGKDVAALTRANLSRFGFKKEVKVVMGAADNSASAIGSGIVNQNDTMMSVGTSGVVFSYTDSLDNDRLHHFSHVKENTSYSMGVTLSAGKSLSWAKDMFFEHLEFDEIFDRIDYSTSKPKSLFFTPYLAGERTPYSDSAIRGSFLGLGLNTSKEDMIKAVTEGITFSLKDCLVLIEEETGKVQNIISVGGGAKNKKWLQLQANIMNRTIKTINFGGGVAYGSVIIALVNLGLFKDYEDATDILVQYGDTYRPQKELAKEYKEKYNKYTCLYHETKNISNV